MTNTKKVSRRKFVSVLSGSFLGFYSGASNAWFQFIPFIIGNLARVLVRRVVVKGVQRATTAVVGASRAKKYAAAAGSVAAFGTELAMAMQERKPSASYPSIGAEVDLSQPDERIYWSHSGSKNTEITIYNPSKKKQAGFIRIILVDEETKEVEHENHLNIILEAQSAASFNYAINSLPSSGYKNIHVTSALNQKSSGAIIVG